MKLLVLASLLGFCTSAFAFPEYPSAPLHVACTSLNSEVGAGEKVSVMDRKTFSLDYGFTEGQKNWYAGSDTIGILLHGQDYLVTVGRGANTSDEILIEIFTGDISLQTVKMPMIYLEQQTIATQKAERTFAAGDSHVNFGGTFNKRFFAISCQKQ